MKMIKYVVPAVLLFFTGKVAAQEKKYQEADLAADSTGLPGDNFSLEAAMDLFKNSKNLEEFEKKLNSKDNGVNNLDLDGDGKIDYIRVIDNKKENAHAIVLQVPVSKTENQDVAVIQIEKKGESNAVAQIVGDSSLYGDAKIVEPVDEGETPDKSNIKRGPAEPFMSPMPIIVNVWFWPCVTYIYEPAYVVWVSPWYWDYWPGWWHPWNPYPWRYYYMGCYPYHHHYHQVWEYRNPYAGGIYAPRRNASSIVERRNRTAMASYQARPNRKAVNTGRPANMGRPSNTGRPSYVRPNEPGRPMNPDGRPSKDQVKPEPRPSTRPNDPTGRPQTQPAPRPSRPDVQSKPSPSVKPEPRPSRPSTRPTPQSRPKPQMSRPHNTSKQHSGNRR